MDIDKLNKIEITGALNGYPAPHLGYGYIGFDTFAQAEEFVNEYGGEIVEFKSRDGWHFWNNKGRVSEAYDIHDYLNKLGDNYSIYSGDKSDEEHFIEIVTNTIQKYYPHGKIELLDVIEEEFKLLEELNSATPTQYIVTNMGRYYETVEGERMSMYHDTHKYAIGVFVGYDHGE